MNYITHPTWYCGVHDYLLDLMSSPFSRTLINLSYRDFSARSERIKAAPYWDDYVSMYLMGGEL